MKYIHIYYLTATLFIGWVGCSQSKKDFDATGNFEADEIIVSAEQTGKILQLDIDEGQTLAANTTVGQIDVSALNIQREQSEASEQAIGQKVNDAAPQVAILQSQIATQKAQIATLQQQMEVQNKEVTRVQNLVKANAVPQKQLDDIMGQRAVLQKQIDAAHEQINVLQAQIAAAKANVSIQNKAILSEMNPAQKRVASIDDQIKRGKIINMVSGTVVAQYAHAGEFAAIGKPLYKIADLSKITLRAYVTGNQLPKIKLNQQVTVRTDEGNGGFKQTAGTITWISSKAEFTPKTIQTKEERANTVYAIKVAVKNDGTYKIGMYGELKL